MKFIAKQVWKSIGGVSEWFCGLEFWVANFFERMLSSLVGFFVSNIIGSCAVGYRI